jgi:hypothetical protein
MDIIIILSLLKPYILFIFITKKKFHVILILKILKFLKIHWFVLNYILRIYYSLFSKIKLIQLEREIIF